MTNNKEPVWAKIRITQSIDDLVKHGPSLKIGVMATPFDGTHVTTAWALIDTGAAGTGISPALARELALKPIDFGMAHEAGREPISAPYFKVKLLLSPNIDMELDVIGLRSMDEYHGLLIGRDVLQNSRIMVDFITGETRIHFRAS